mmetsp:Transcript_21831/g.30774  ORF Transcript_21831/g.30774 Transcript_21831/m.30774 type:complete len:431 (+) Transcript_21831:145-1437(+)
MVTMGLKLACTLSLLSASQTVAFVPKGCLQECKPSSLLPKTTTSSLSNHKSPFNDVAALTLAGMVFASSFGSMATPRPANAVELSSGAIVIETSQKEGQSLLKAEFDAKSILTTLFKNRKELTSSSKKMVNYVNDELNTAAWVELKKEILQIEDDVTPEVKVLPPQDWKQTVKDITMGKLNFIINGEIVNVAVEPSFGEKEDELIIRAKGLKNVPLPELSEPQIVAKNRIQEQLDELYFFWNSPVPVPYFEEKGIKINNGAAIVVGGTASIAGIYAASYAYYLSELAKEEKAAEEKRLEIAARKKAASKNKKKVDTPSPKAEEVQTKTDVEAKKVAKTSKAPETSGKTDTKAETPKLKKSLAEDQAEKAARAAIKEAGTVAMVTEAKTEDLIEDSKSEAPIQQQKVVSSKAKAVGPKKKRRKWYKLWLSS